MNQLYNKSALDKVSAQNQLDKMVHLVPASIWVSILGAVLIITGLLIWAFKGSIPTSLEGVGIYMKEEGLKGQYANTSGMLLNINVKPGDYVKQGDEIATIVDNEYFDLSQIDERIAYVENMTFESDLDAITSDTEELAEIKRKANTPDSSEHSNQASLDMKRDKLTQLAGDIEDKRAEMLKYKETYYSTLALDDPVSEMKYNESESDYQTSRSAYETAKNSYLSSQDNYYEKKKKFDAQYRHFDYENATEEQQRVYDTDLADLQAVADEAEDFTILLEDAEENYDTANINLDAARENYLEKLNEASGFSVENTIAHNEYSELLNAYNTLLSEYRNLNNEIGELEINLIVSKFDKLNEYDGYCRQFDNQKNVVLSRLEKERESVLNDITKDTVYASNDGKIYRIDAEIGSAINKGDKLVSIFPDTEEDEISVMCYVPYTQITELSHGQEIHVTPTGLNSNEYGYAFGKIVKVSKYLESNQSMMNTLNNENLIKQLTEQGAVGVVQCSLDKDNDSKSGYLWSNPKGDKKGLTLGDMVNVVFITDTKRPIDVFIPYLKDKLDFEKDKEDTNN